MLEPATVHLPPIKSEKQATQLRTPGARYALWGRFAWGQRPLQAYAATRTMRTTTLTILDLGGDPHGGHAFCPSYTDDSDNVI